MKLLLSQGKNHEALAYYEVLSVCSRNFWIVSIPCLKAV